MPLFLTSQTCESSITFFCLQAAQRKQKWEPNLLPVQTCGLNIHKKAVRTKDSGKGQKAVGGRVQLGLNDEGGMGLEGKERHGEGIQFISGLVLLWVNGQRGRNTDATLFFQWFLPPPHRLPFLPLWAQQWTWHSWVIPANLHNNAPWKSAVKCCFFSLLWALCAWVAWQHRAVPEPFPSCNMLSILVFWWLVGEHTWCGVVGFGGCFFFFFSWFCWFPSL